MDVEKFKKDHQELMVQVAGTQVARQIGEAVLRLAAQGQPLSVDVLVRAMRQSVAHLDEQHLERLSAEAAIAALQDAAKPK